MDGLEFLAVIEIPKSKRILCQSEGCGHSVYKRVHIIKQNNVIGVYGSECAKKIFGTWLKSEVPSFTSTSGVKLSESEVGQLRDNTEKLLEKLRANSSKLAVSEIPKAVVTLSNSQIHTGVEGYKAENYKTKFKSLNPEISDRLRLNIEQLYESSKKGKSTAIRDLEYFLKKYKLEVRNGVIVDHN